nr:hypothetical protein [Thermoanaerobaculales bacterium]
MKQASAPLTGTPATPLLKGRSTWHHPTFPVTAAAPARHTPRGAWPIVTSLVLATLCGLAQAAEPTGDDPVFALRGEEARGYSSGGMNLSEYEQVNLANGNLTLAVPLASVTTDGGLSYSVSAHYNTKIGGVGETFGYYRGVESYGLGWDLRPPRVSAWFECDQSSLSYPEECPPGSTDHPIKYTILSLTSQSGAEQQVIAVPPGPWKDAGNLGYDIDDDGYSGEVCPRTTVPGPYEDPFGDCRCVARTGELSICFTWDEPLVRITIDAQTTPVTVVVEDESGTVSRFGQIVDVRSRVSRQAPWAQLSPEEIEVVNFREEVDGFYLTSLERGPWQDDVAANVITFDYDDDTPWLVESIRANGAVERRIDFDYNSHPIGELDPPPMMLDTITAPAFSGGQRVISFEYNDDLPVNAWPDEPPSPHLPPDWTWDAPFLSSIVSDAGAGGGDLEWAFSTGIPPNPLNEVHIRVFTLPTGGTIEYEYTGFPQVGLCQFPEEDPLETQGVWFGSAALFRRTIRIPDATLSDSDPVMRVETTAMARNINCPGIPNPYQLEFPDCMPYPDSPFFQGIPQLLGQAAYRWVWVETYAGDAAPWDMTTTSTGEIHRFFFHNFREFSADYFSTIPTSARGVVAEFYPNRQLGRWRPKDESFLLGWDDVQVLRHQQTRRATLFGDDYSNPVNYTKIPCCPMPWEHVFNTVERSTTITNETGGDVRSCALLVPNDPEAVECQAVTTELDISDFFRTESETTIVAGSAIPDHESRTTAYGYADPEILQNPLVWDLGKPNFAATCTSPPCWAEAVRSRWELQQGYVRLKTQWTNPQPGGEYLWRCDADIADCTQTDYSYDENGNVNRVSRSGGYATGFSQSVPDEVTGYLHGRPFRRSLEDGSTSLLLWEKGIDPGTGLTRWAVDGSGAGKAYLYDSLGRVTDSAPIEGDQGAGGEWSLTLQPYEYDTTGNPLFIKGSHFTYLNPAAETLAMREAWDASYDLSPSGELSLAAPPEFELRARLHLDGIGRPTQLTERRPDGSGSRTRYSLGYFHDSSAGSVLNPCDLGATTLTNPARVDLLSEWVDGDGDSWPGCATLSWSSTHYDGLNRPALQALPDGSSISTGYRGSGTTTTTRTVATSTTQNESEMETVAVKDAFGRLRRLLEQETPGTVGCLSNPALCIESLYEYDVKDRLRQVAVAANSVPQNRSFEYSGAGFLLSSTEPERYTTYRSYDAMGNLREEVTKLDTTLADPDPVGYEFDGFSRLVRKFIGPPTFELDLATFDYGSSGIGTPGYNKVEEASQVNRYGSGSDAPTVIVSQTWEYGGPGGRVSSRTTRIGDPVTGNGFGEPDDGFVLEYL